MVVYNHDLEKLVEENKVPVSGSNRHVHLSPEHLELLFGKGYQLKSIKNLSQPGQFAADECVTLSGPKGEKKGVRILGPVRGNTQVELLAGDCIQLGIPMCVRNSGEIAGSPGIKITGPNGTVEIKEGAIIAARHIHMHTDEAKKYGYKDKDKVSVRTFGDRAVTFHNVLIRVHNEYALDMHIDLEEINAAFLKNGELVQIIR
ncbi:MAG: phosphate propanoyltransferase [Candidatus Wallbacteria bacterium]